MPALRLRDGCQNGCKIYVCHVILSAHRQDWAASCEGQRRANRDSRGFVRQRHPPTDNPLSPSPVGVSLRAASAGSSVGSGAHNTAAVALHPLAGRSFARRRPAVLTGILSMPLRHLRDNHASQMSTNRVFWTKGGGGRAAPKRGSRRATRRSRLTVWSVFLQWRASIAPAGPYISRDCKRPACTVEGGYRGVSENGREISCSPSTAL